MSRRIAVLISIIALSLPIHAFAQPKSAINLSSIEKAASEVQQAWQAVVDADKAKNKVAESMARAKAGASFSSMIGNTIDWRVKVLAVEQQGIQFTAHRIERKGDKAGVMLGVCPLNPAKRTAKAPIDWAMPAPNEPWVAKLKAGDFVRVQGRIAAFRNNGSLTLAVMLGEYKLSPVELEKKD